MLNEGNLEGVDTISFARSRISQSPVAGWVVECTFNPEFKPATEAPVTFLLSDTQIHAEQHEVFTHQVVRLATMEAVQHWSQWRLQFEPKTQTVTLHTLKVRRGDVEIDQLKLEKVHLLQREEGLERFVIHGWFTLLMVLEDVRPGDVLDFSYTIQSQKSMFPNQGGYFFTLPQGITVGKYHFSALFNVSRSRKWKSSATDLTPVETREDDMIFWEWSRKNSAGQKPEVNTPAWSVPVPWIQVSDFADWQVIAAGIAEAWMVQDDGAAIAEIASDIEKKEPEVAARIERAIRLVQDECRYLSVNLEFGGQTPTPPETVAKRRFGDCKDLSFLLAKLLKKLGVEARPVLVHSFLRKSIGDFLPLPSLFNHAIVEVELEGKRRWIDATFKSQGGGVLNRIIPDYGMGLPIGGRAEGLVKAPPIEEQPDQFDLREHILLDTSGGASLMEVTLQTEGSQAEILRRQIENAGVEETGKQRLQVMANRFGSATRIGALQYRDDRAANRFILVEVFEIKFILGRHPNDRLCRFALPGNWLVGVLGVPQKDLARRTPFALPYPCHINYKADIDSPAIQKMRLNDPEGHIKSAYVEFKRNSRAGNGYFVMDLSLTTKADSVPPDQVEKHREVLERMWNEASRELFLPKEYVRPRQKPGFGDLPSVPNGNVTAKPATQPAPAPPPAKQMTLGFEKKTSPKSRGQRARHEPKLNNPFAIPTWLKILGIIFVLFWVLMIWFIVTKAR